MNTITDKLTDLCEANDHWMYFDLYHLKNTYTIGYKHSVKTAKKFKDAKAALAHAEFLVGCRKSFLARV